MRNYLDAITVMNAANPQDCVIVAGMVGLRQSGPQRPHLFGPRPMCLATRCATYLPTAELPVQFAARANSAGKSSAKVVVGRVACGSAGSSVCHPSSTVVCSLERLSGHVWRERLCSAKPCAKRRLARRVAARTSR